MDIIDKKLEENKHTLKINQVPIEYKRYFIEMSENFYENNYGMFLMELIKTYQNQKTTEAIMERIIQLENEINEIKNKPKEEKIIKTLSGKDLIRGDKNE